MRMQNVKIVLPAAASFALSSGFLHFIPLRQGAHMPRTEVFISALPLRGSGSSIACSPVSRSGGAHCVR
jgi:hypothetical protein